MTQPTAHDLYGWLVQVIDRAVEAKDIFSVTKAAEAFGMSGGEEDYGGFGQRWNYSFTDSNGRVVSVHARWWDQSKAFSIQPDRHVMSVELLGGDTALSHSGNYEQ